MKSQKLVLMFTVFLRFFLLVSTIAGIALVWVAIHSTISPTTYEKLIIERENQNYKLWYSSNIPKMMNSSDWNIINSYGKEIYYFTKQDTATRIRIMVTMLIQLTIVFLVTKELLKFTANTNSPQTIFLNNSQCFSRISVYLGIYTLFVIIASFFPVEFKSLFLDGGGVDAIKVNFTKTYSFYVDFELIVFLFISLFLSAVFKEGERLRVENELTI